MMMGKISPKLCSPQRLRFTVNAGNCILLIIRAMGKTMIFWFSVLEMTTGCYTALPWGAMTTFKGKQKTIPSQGVMDATGFTDTGATTAF